MNQLYHTRKITRLKKFDYSQPGSYFITICCTHHQSFLGEINGQQFFPSPEGAMVRIWWDKLPEKFNTVSLGDYVVMPNHFHGIITLVGADPWSARDNDPWSARDNDPWSARDNDPWSARDKNSPKSPDIPHIIQWFKTMSANEYRRINNAQTCFGRTQLWQRSYYDHIIRNTREYGRISEYIRNNPSRWHSDCFGPTP